MTTYNRRRQDAVLGIAERDRLSLQDIPVQPFGGNTLQQTMIMRTPGRDDIVGLADLAEDFDKLQFVSAGEMDRGANLTSVESVGDALLEVDQIGRAKGVAHCAILFLIPSTASRNARAALNNSICSAKPLLCSMSR